MRTTETTRSFPNTAVPSAYTAGQYSREWIVKEAAHRQQLQLVREAQDADPGRVVRTRRKAGYLLIRAGIRLCAVSFPPRNRRVTVSQ